MNCCEINQRHVDGTRRTPLTFIEQPTAKRQTRLLDRLLLTPEIDLAAYECRAVIDWVDVRCYFGRASQGVAINAHLKKVLGRSIHVREEGDNQTFRIRIQEPTGKLLDRLVRAIEEHWGMRAEPDVLGLEISVDFRPKVHSVEALDRMFGVLVRTHFPSRDVLSSKNDRPRAGWRMRKDSHISFLLPWSRSGPSRTLLALTTAENQPALLGATFYEGAKDSVSQWRIMVKEVDQQNIAAGTRKVLPDEEHRVRIEVTLDFRELHRLGITTLADLKAFRFQTFQGEYFQFRLPTFRDTSRPENARQSSWAIEACRRAKFLRAGIIGLREMDDAFFMGRERKRARLRKRLGSMQAPKKRTGRGASSTLVAYEALTRRVATALRHLGERMAGDAAPADPGQPRVDSSSSSALIGESERA